MDRYLLQTMRAPCPRGGLWTGIFYKQCMHQIPEGGCGQVSFTNNAYTMPQREVVDRYLLQTMHAPDPRGRLWTGIFYKQCMHQIPEGGCGQVSFTNNACTRSQREVVDRYLLQTMHAPDPRGRLWTGIFYKQCMHQIPEGGCGQVSFTNNACTRSQREVVDRYLLQTMHAPDPRGRLWTGIFYKHFMHQTPEGGCGQVSFTNNACTRSQREVVDRYLLQTMHAPDPRGRLWTGVFYKQCMHQIPEGGCGQVSFTNNACTRSQREVVDRCLLQTMHAPDPRGRLWTGVFYKQCMHQIPEGGCGLVSFTNNACTRSQREVVDRCLLQTMHAPDPRGRLWTGVFYKQCMHQIPEGGCGQVSFTNNACTRSQREVVDRCLLQTIHTPCPRGRLWTGIFYKQCMHQIPEGGWLTHV